MPSACYPHGSATFTTTSFTCGRFRSQTSALSNFGVYHSLLRCSSCTGRACTIVFPLLPFCLLPKWLQEGTVLLPRVMSAVYHSIDLGWNRGYVGKMG